LRLGRFYNFSSKRDFTLFLVVNSSELIIILPLWRRQHNSNLALARALIRCSNLICEVTAAAMN
jgi:hypothetical protein